MKNFRIFILVLTTSVIFADSNLLYQNFIASGSTQKNKLYNYTKSKLLFAEAIKYSQTSQDHEIAELLYNSTSQVNLNAIFDFKARGAFFSKDETKILAWDESQIKFIDIQTHKIIFTATHNLIKNAKFSKDERFLFTWGGGAEIKMWDVKNAKLITNFSHRRGEVYGIKLSHDEKQLLSFAKDNRVRLWDLKSKKMIFKYRHKKLKGAEFSNDDKFIYSFGKKKVKKFNIEKKEISLTFDLDFWARGMKLDNLQSQLLVWNLRYIYIFDTENGRLLLKMRNDDKSHLKTVISDEYFNRFLFWDIKSGRIRFKDISDYNFFDINHNGKISGAILTENKIFSWSESHLFVTRISDAKLISHINYNHKITGVKIIDENKLAVWGLGDEIKFYEIDADKKQILDIDKVSKNSLKIANEDEKLILFAKEKKEKSTAFYGGKIGDVKFNKSENKFLSWGERELKLWNIQKENRVKFAGITNQYYIKNIKFMDEMSKTIVVTYDNIYFYDNEKRELIFTIKPDRYKFFKRTNLNQDESEMVIVQKNILSVVDIENQREIWEKGVENIVDAIYCGEMIVSWGRRDIKVWDSDGGVVNDMNFSDNIFAVTPNENGSEVLFIQNRVVKLFDMKKNREILTLDDENIVGAVFDKNESKIITWSFSVNGGEMKIWDKRNGELLMAKNISEFKNLTLDKYDLNSFFSKSMIYDISQKSQKNMIFVKHYDKTLYYEKFDIILSSSKIEIREKKGGSLLFTFEYPAVRGIYYDKKSDMLVILSDDNLIFKNLSNKKLIKKQYQLDVKLSTGAKFGEYFKIAPINFQDWQKLTKIMKKNFDIVDVP